MITIKIVIYHIYHKNLISHCQDHQRGLPNIFASFCVNSWGQALSGLDFVEAPRKAPEPKPWWFQHGKIVNDVNFDHQEMGTDK